MTTSAAATNKIDLEQEKKDLHDLNDSSPMPPHRLDQMYDRLGRYSIGTFIGEEWIFFRKYTDRKETCVAREPSCVLELSTNAYETIIEALFESGMGKDVSMLETQLKRSYNIKKARISHQ